jgi:hypothetical protein
MHHLVALVTWMIVWDVFQLDEGDTLESRVLVLLLLLLAVVSSKTYL